MEDSLITIEVNARLLKKIEETLENEDISLNTLIELYLGTLTRKNKIPDYIRIYDYEIDEEELIELMDIDDIVIDEEDEKAIEISYKKALMLVNENYKEEEDRIEIKIYYKAVEAVIKVIESSGYTLMDVINIYLFALAHTKKKGKNFSELKDAFYPCDAQFLVNKLQGISPYKN